MGPRIGKGSYGDVFKADWRGILVAVKRLPANILQDESFMDNFASEALIMSCLRHPNVLMVIYRTKPTPLQFLGTCLMDGDLCIITEFMSKGSLNTILKKEEIEITFDMVKKVLYPPIILNSSLQWMRHKECCIYMPQILQFYIAI
jgi:serine/threonine protein kinase